MSSPLLCFVAVEWKREFADRNSRFSHYMRGIHYNRNKCVANFVYN